jgi:hypothetical protein
LLLGTGYLKVIETVDVTDGIYKVKLPNEEIKYLFRGIIRDWFSNKVIGNDLNSIMKTKPKLYRYMLSHLSILMTINSIYLIKIGTLESYQKKSEIWKFLEEKDQIAYKKCKQKFVGIASSENKFVCELCKGIYVIARKIFKFN